VGEITVHDFEVSADVKQVFAKNWAFKNESYISKNKFCISKKYKMALK